MTDVASIKPRILPPKGLLIAMTGQLPLLAVNVPLHPSTWQVVSGVTLLMAGAALNVWAERLFRVSDVGVCPFTHVPQVVERGPYRITRNPMYLGLISLNLGVTLLSGVLENLWSSVAFAIWLHYAFVLPEEGFLRHQLGVAFEDYSRRVPRWLIARS